MEILRGADLESTFRDLDELHAALIEFREHDQRPAPARPDSGDCSVALYSSGSQLTSEQHQKLFMRAKASVQQEKTRLDKKFDDEIRLIRRGLS